MNYKTFCLSSNQHVHVPLGIVWDSLWWIPGNPDECHPKHLYLEIKYSLFNYRYSLYLFVHAFFWKKNSFKKLYQLTLIQHFMDVIWPRILCISIIKENQVPKIIVTLIMTIFYFFYVNYLLIKEYFNINFVQKLRTCILEICSFFLTKCWFQSLLIKVVYLMSITPKCLKLIMIWLHNFTSLKH